VRLFARFLQWLRRKPQPEVLDERHAYERCHGQRPGDVRVMARPLPVPRLLPRLPGDHLRRCFEERLEGRRRVHS
jgi:hypothetical protein